MKSGLKRSGKSSSKPPSRSKDRSTDKPAPTSSKNNKNRSASVPKSTSQSASRKNKLTSAKTKTPASVPKSSGASTLRATRKSTHATQQKSSTKSKSQSPKSKSASRQNTSKAPSKPNTPKNQPKKPAVKPTSSKNAPKTKKPPVSKSQDRSATPSPKRSETPEKTNQKGKATSKADKQAQKPKPVPIRRSSRFREQPKKPKEAESRSQSRSRSAAESPAKEKASPPKKNASKPESARMSQEREAVEETKMEVVGQMDLLVPDPVSEFIRDSEGHLVKKLTEQDQEDALRMNLEAILDDDNYEVAIKMVNTEESRRYGRQGVREEQKVQAQREASDDEDGYEIKEYSLFEDWRLIEAAEAYKQVKGPRGLGSRKIWETMLDPDTGELLFGGRRTMRSLVNRYSLFMAHLSAEEQAMIQELGNSLPEHRMRRLRGQYSKASGKNRLLGIVEQIYDAPEQRMWLNPSTTRNQNAKPVSIEEFVKKSVEKTRGRTMEVEEEEEEEQEEEKKVQMTSRAKKAAASKERAQPQPKKRSVGKESKESKERVVQEKNRSISKERVRDIETEKMLIAQKNYLKLKQLQAVVKTVEEEEEEAGRKKFKNNAGKEVTILADDNRRRQAQAQAQVQEQPKQPEKRLTKKEKAQMREQRRNEQELKQLKDTWVYDANSLSLSEVFGARRPLGEIDIDPTLSLYVDFDEGFRQFVREIGARRANKVSERDMKWARLSKYAKEYGLPLSEVISIFNRVSCDNQDLELFLNSGDEGLLWTDQEDRDLLNNDQIALRYLVKIKGPLRIKKRREFLLKLT